MFNYVKKEYQFVGDVESVKSIIKRTIDNLVNESTTGVLNKDNSFWIRDKYKFFSQSIPSIPSKINGRIFERNHKTIISIRIVPDTIYFYLQLIAFIFIIFDQMEEIKLLSILAGVGFIIALSLIAYLDSKFINRKFERILRNTK
jgi:hypothetical protein